MFHHVTVLLQEAVEGLHIRPDGIYVDCTLGGAGHSALIASKLGDQGKLIAIDQDDVALANAKEKLQSYGDKVILVKSNFSYLKDVVQDLGLDGVDGVLFDLGVSSPQLDVEERGFSYNGDAPLDMRMDQQADLSAYDIVNEWEEAEISKIIFAYGEEKFARKIARQIVLHREKAPIETTSQLVEIIKEAIPAPARRTGPHPAKRTFQAIRIAVNDELNVFKTAVSDAIDILRPGGRVSVITFHSLEDRICKHAYLEKAQGCTCPPGFPQCVCGNEPIVKIITRKPLLPSEEELTDNPRARSAKLRIAEKK
ncbi:16S rRNA (cytosine(1402)-N(4))-methyltransferase RsmH [Brevibacillus laterosporus]|uniref:Ribosomal RNA small subunit methyltransferase H n=1 Tax=Brevibacillus laterosporus TaxID=1465 RepID=A0A518VDY2_BRELA|nr:16S rRNA (cytosine(1402)-N(4))-methyltransferase RsmH [Brevibacillus laterosporus]